MRKLYILAVAAACAISSTIADVSLTWTGGAGKHDDGYWHFEEAGNWTGGTLTMSDTSKYHLTFPAVASADEVKILMPDGGGNLGDGGKNFKGNLTIGDDDASKHARYTFVSAVPRSYGTADSVDALYTYGANAEVRYVNFGSADYVARFGGAGNMFVVNAGGSVTFENCTMMFGSWKDVTEEVAGNVTLSNTVASSGKYVIKSGGRLTVAGGSEFSHNGDQFTIEEGADLVIDDSTFKITNAGSAGFYFHGTLTFIGPDARFCTPSQWTNGKAGARCVFVVPEGGYSYIPYVNGSASGKFTDGITFEISPESPIFQSDWNYNVPEESAKIIPLFGWNKGTDDRIKTVAPDLTGLGEVACKWYHSTAALTPEIAAAGVAPAGMTWSSGRDAGDNERYLGVYILGEPSGGPEPEEPTASVLDAANVVSSIDQRTVTVSGALTSRGSGDTRVYVKVGDGVPELVATFDYRSRTLGWTWQRKLANFGDTIAGTVYIVNGPKDNPNQFTSEPVAFGPFTAVDNAVYAWKGGAGAWTDAAKWTADKEDHADIPPAGAQVTIPSAAVVTIDNAAVSAGALTLASGAQLVFKGAAPSLTLATLAGAGAFMFEIPQGGWASAPLVGTDAAELANVSLSVSRESPALFGSTEWTTSTLVNWAAGVGSSVTLDQGDEGRISAMAESGGTVTVQTRRAPDVVLAAIPEVENASLVSVKVGETVITPQANGTYLIPGGSDVKVTFRPDKGYGLTATEVVFNVGFGATSVFPADRLPQAIEGGSIVINEAMASNKTGLKTAGGIAEIDWIELRNDSDAEIDLAADGWMLTDNPAKPKKAKPIAGRAILPANGYLVVFADKTCTNWVDASEAHVAIGLSSSGENIALVSPDGVVVSTFSFGQQLGDVSVGLPGGGDSNEVVFFRTPTPGAANPASGCKGMTPEVLFSEPHGWKTAPFKLELSCKDGVDRDIYYTLDGTSPTADSTKYSGPISVDKTTVVRAAVIDPEAILQRDYSATYLYLDQLLDNSVDHRPAGFQSGWDAQKERFRNFNLRDDVVNSTDPEVLRRIHDGFTNSIRTLSIVINPSYLFDWQEGIYIGPNARWDGRESERMTMLEQINPRDPDDGFSVPCGIRIRGAGSRDERAKHSFHIFFRSEYGMSNLAFPLFGEEGSDTFKKIDLRTDQNQSYERGFEDSTFVHELFARDCERDFGKTYNRSQYLHLFINGSYFGMYQYEERCSSDYGEENLGGRAENWQVVRSDHNYHNAYFVDGPGSAEENGGANAANTANCELWHISIDQGYKTGTQYESNFMKVLGRNPDGTRNPAYPIYLNITNLIGFCFSSHLGADTDSPCNGTPTVNNINALRYVIDGEANEDGWIWNRHDAEWTLCWFNDFGKDYKCDNTELGKRNTYFNPHGLHCALVENDEYRMIFSDQVYRHFVRKGGSMTVEKCTERFKARMDEIDSAIVCESARWHRYATHEHWIKSCSKCLAFITNRVPYLVGTIYRNKNWYPSVDAPTSLDKSGETVMDGDTFGAGETISFANADQGTVYYTLDGSDPRLEGGSLNAAATPYSTAFELPAGTSTIHARVLSAQGEWSALEEVTVKGAAPAETADPKDALRVAEVMSSSACADNDADDYLVLTNLADSAVSLANVKLVAWNAKKKSEADPSLTLTFAGTTQIPAHGSLKLTMSDFAGGKLANSKVGLRLYDVSGAAPFLFQDCLVDADWWDKACDGKGGSFIAKEFGAVVKTESQWRASNEVPPPEGDEVESEDGGYRFVLEGDYDGVKSITPTGAECRVILKGARVPDGLLLNGAAVFEFKPDAETTNDIGSVYGPTATFKIEGDGAVRLEGADTLATVSNLHVKAGALLVKSTGVAVTKTPVVKVLGYARETGGEIDIDLDVATTNQIYGIFLANKDLKDADDVNLGVVYAEISGGAFNATVGGTKSAALYVDKGSVDTTFKDTNTVVTVRLCGVEPRFVNVAGDLEIKNGSFTVTMPESCASVVNARVFKCDKDIDLQGGSFDINVPGPGAEVFCADEIGGEIDIDGGTFEIVSDDDCFSAMDRISVDGGLIYAVSLNNDVFDSNGDMRLRGGTILAYAAANGHEAFDVDPNETAEGANAHTLTISNAVIFATGGKSADWPNALVLGDGTKAVVLEEQISSTYAEKYLTLVDVATGTSYAAKLPRFPDTKCAILATVPGYDGSEPTLSATAPERGDQDFHGYYVWSAGGTEVSPGHPAAVEAADGAAARAAVVFRVAVPTDGDGTAIVDETTYKGYFKLVAEPVTGESGKFTVSAELNETLVCPVIAKTMAIDEPFTIDESTSEVTVESKKGLYYSLVRGATVDEIETVVDTKLATGDAVTLTDAAKLPLAAFYRVSVSFAF